MVSWTIARQAPLSMGFLRQEYWSGLPFPSPGDLPDLGNEPVSPTLAGGFFFCVCERERSAFYYRIPCSVFTVSMMKGL